MTRFFSSTGQSTLRETLFLRSKYDVCNSSWPNSFEDEEHLSTSGVVRPSLPPTGQHSSATNTIVPSDAKPLPTMSQAMHEGKFSG